MHKLFHIRNIEALNIKRDIRKTKKTILAIASLLCYGVSWIILKNTKPSMKNYLIACCFLHLLLRSHNAIKAELPHNDYL